jgi:membrane protein implicated in regulation of membrane protease activity
MRLHRWLALLPVVHALAGVVLANRVRPFVLGLPFFMAWTIAGVLLAAAVMALIYRLDPANREAENENESNGDGDGGQRGGLGNDESPAEGRA